MSSSDKGIQYGSDLAGERQQALRESGSMDAGFQEMADNVYAHLKDEISKKIFNARIVKLYDFISSGPHHSPNVIVSKHLF